MLDATVAMAFTWPDVHSAAADRFFGAVRRQWLELIAPDYWLVDCADRCRQRVEKRLNTPDESLAAHRAISLLPVVRMDTRSITDVVLPLALELRITSFDALYVATAQFAGVPLITAETRLVAALRESGWAGRVEHLGEWGA